ncbi:hypothetical protein F5Y16DRAFT_362511 [Xylariaceae sp. FL0255]|nr:hypothetical protein F5Y16DRAFT_362511 [Xylariaceae sp. FL0255]
MYRVIVLIILLAFLCRRGLEKFSLVIRRRICRRICSSNYGIFSPAVFTHETLEDLGRQKLFLDLLSILRSSLNNEWVFPEK